MSPSISSGVGVQPLMVRARQPSLNRTVDTAGPEVTPGVSLVLAALFLSAQLLVTFEAFGVELSMPTGGKASSAPAAVILAAGRRFHAIHRIT